MKSARVVGRELVVWNTTGVRQKLYPDDESVPYHLNRIQAWTLYFDVHVNCYRFL